MWRKRSGGSGGVREYLGVVWVYWEEVENLWVRSVFFLVVVGKIEMDLGVLIGGVFMLEVESVVGEM